MKKRKSNIELLRIVMILMVILNHYLNGDMGGLLNHTQSNTPNYYLGRLLYSMCVVAKISSFKFSQLYRITMYFATGEIILIPFMIENIRNYRLKRIISGIVTIGLVAYFIVIQVFRPEWSNIVPYHWFNY